MTFDTSNIISTTVEVHLFNKINAKKLNHSSIIFQATTSIYDLGKFSVHALGVGDKRYDCSFI